MERCCRIGNLNRDHSSILLIGEGRQYGYDHYIQVNCVRCGCGEEIYDREFRDYNAKKINIADIHFPYSVFVREYQYVQELLGLKQVENETIYEIIIAIVDAYRKNYFMYWEEYIFEDVRKAIVNVLLLKKYDECSKKFLAAMYKELKKIVQEPFDLEEFLQNVKSEDFGIEFHKKYGPAGVMQIGCAEGRTYSEKYLERKVYLRTKRDINNHILRLQKRIIQNMVRILKQNYKCRDFHQLKIDGRISFASIKYFVNDLNRDSIYLKGYVLIFREILKIEFVTAKDINEGNYKEKLEKLEKVDEFVSRYLN